MISILAFLIFSGHPTTGATATTIPAVPRPDLGHLTGPARKSVELAQTTLQQRIDEGTEKSEQLAPDFAFLGQLFSAYELFTEAESCYSAAHDLQPESGAWLYLRGLTRGELDRIHDAIDDLRAAVALQPDLIPAWLQLGELLLAAQQPDEAREAFESVLARESQNGAAEFGLGLAELASGEYAAAIDYLEMALSLQPSASVVHAPLEKAYRALGQPDRANQHHSRSGDVEFQVADPFTDAIDRIRLVTDFMVLQEMVRSTSFQETQFLDLTLDGIGSTPGAIDQLDSLLRENQDVGGTVALGRIHYGRAALLLRAGREDEAKEDLEVAIQLAPTLIDARLQLGNILARSGRFGDAVHEYDGLLTLSPDHTDALLKRAAARANLGHLADARLDLEHALGVAREPKTIAQARTLLAGLDRAQRHLAEAEGNFRAALAADPDNIPALSGLASLLGQRGRYREAATYFHDVIGLEPSNGSARLGEAIALLLIEDYPSARARLEEGIAELPDDLILRQKLALLLAACPDRTQRDGPRAVELAKQLFAKRPDAESVEVLAMAYAEAGDFAKATTWQKRLLSAGDAPAEDHQRAVWQQNLTRYESGLSCCAGDQEPSAQGEK